MIRKEKCEVLDKQNFEPKYRMVYDNWTRFTSQIMQDWVQVQLHNNVLLKNIIQDLFHQQFIIYQYVRKDHSH